MAEFELAFAPMLQHEGFPGYVNDPSDHGGETVAGITRKNWPGASVWPMVDAAKLKGGKINDHLRKDPYFLPAVKDFYKRNFWRPMFESLDSQELASWLFDKSVNCGMTQPVKWLQRALDIQADGQFGPLTLAKANGHPNPVRLLEECREQARKFYRSLVAKDETQAKFLNGWLARV